MYIVFICQSNLTLCSRTWCLVYRLKWSVSFVYFIHLHHRKNHHAVKFQLTYKQKSKFSVWTFHSKRFWISQPSFLVYNRFQYILFQTTSLLTYCQMLLRKNWIILHQSYGTFKFQSCKKWRIVGCFQELYAIVHATISQLKGCSMNHAGKSLRRQAT